MKTRTIDTYEYDELSDQAKAKARDWFREGNASENLFAESVEEDAREVLKLCGFTLDKRGIAWSGFGSQGDGASFTGTWSASDVNAKALKEYAPEDRELHRIVDGLADLAKRFPEGDAILQRNTHQYCHKYTVNAVTDVPDLEDLARDLMRWIYRQLEQAYGYENSDEQVAETIRANEYDFTKEGKRTVVL